MTDDAKPARTFLKDLRPGEHTDQPYVISQVQLRLNKNGSPYLTMIVGDKSASVDAKWWDQGEAMFKRLPNPGVVRVKGVVEEFNGRPQLKIEKVLQLRDPDTIDYGELLPQTDKDIDAMFAELAAMLRSMTSPTLRGLAEAYLSDDELMTRLRRAPAAMTFHHAYLGGLLEHTLNAMRAAHRLAPLYPGLNRDVCVFGVFVHDLAKTWELTYEAGFDYGEGGRLVGHVVKGALWLEDKARHAATAGTPVPRTLLDVLQHIVLSHHGELSLGYGSAMNPLTPEAFFVHHVENLDAKMTMALAACRADAADDTRWTNFHKALGGRLFRPDAASDADADTSVEAQASPATPATPASSLFATQT